VRESEERFRSVFETSPLGLALIDQDQKLVQVNPSLCRLSGYSAEELMGLKPIDSTYPDDLPKSQEMAERLFKGEIPHYQLEKRYIKKNGEIMWTTLTATILRDREGRPLMGLGMIEDITERKLAQEALRQSEEQFRAVFEQGPLGVTLIGKDYRLVKVNQAFCRMMEYSEAELTRMTPLDFTYPDDREGTQERVQRLFETGVAVQNVEKRYVTKSGGIIWGSLNTSVIHDREGRLIYAMGMIEDITERKRTEEELRTLSERLSQAIRFGAMSVWEWDPRTHSFVWDDAAFETSGIPKQLPLSHDQWLNTLHVDDRPAAQAALEKVVREKRQVSVEYRVVRPDGGVRYAYAAGGPVLDQEGNVVRVVGIAVDITARKRAEEDMRALSERLKLATRSASMGVWEWNLDSNLSIWDDAMFDIIGIPKRARVSREDWVQNIHRDDWVKTENFLETVVREKAHQEIELRIVRPYDGVRQIYSAAGPVLDKKGNVVGVVGITEDITERKRTEEQLRTLSERLSLATRIAAMGVFDWDLRTNLQVWDDACFEMFGIPRTASVQHESFVNQVHPDDRVIVGETSERVLHNRTRESVEFRIVRPSGEVRHLSVAAGPAVDEEGRVIRVVGVVIDITAHKQLEEDLEAAREQAITSARLSALGMMAGGIAHEINNPLSIIHAMASDLHDMVVEEGSAPPQVVARKSGIIRETAERIAKIVKSLRQISREGAADPPHPTRVAKILEETLEICRAKFTAHGVALLLPKVVPDLSVPCREVQIAQALLNLLTNAFDAVVDQEGERWVRIALGEHDDSVSISVIDSGPGIPAELRVRIMEPFFTTKEVGKGTGLGLSLSKTIAEEHGGRLEYGEEDGHTRFSLVLPLARQAEAA
jgi:PAS domain S-box-containing protein